MAGRRAITRGQVPLPTTTLLAGAVNWEGVFVQDEDGDPIEGELQLWLTPRASEVGVTVDVDWTP